MTSEKLEANCVKRFGKDVGRKMYFAMRIIKNIDFCVATSWEPNQISIARSCSHRGRVFEFSEDYNGLFLPDIGIIKIKDLGHTDLSLYLPKSPQIRGHRNCSIDDNLRG